MHVNQAGAELCHSSNRKWQYPIDHISRTAEFPEEITWRKKVRNLQFHPVKPSTCDSSDRVGGGFTECKEHQENVAYPRRTLWIALSSCAADQNRADPRAIYLQTRCSHQINIVRATGL